MKYINTFETYNNNLPEFIDINGVLYSTRNSNDEYISSNIEYIYNFYKWFGSSQFLDENKRPLVCYHGTGHEITVFQPSRFGKMGAGIYFTSIKKDAQYHQRKYSGNYLMDVYLKGDDLAEITNPFTKHELPSSYDSIIAFKGQSGEEILVKSPNQIKSIKNDGSYDIDDDNIYS